MDDAPCHHEPAPHSLYSGDEEPRLARLKIIKISLCSGERTSDIDSRSDMGRSVPRGLGGRCTTSTCVLTVEIDTGKADAGM
jgi:hypothetical protein